MAINSTLANQIFFASQGVPATGKENSAGQAYANEVAYAHAATYNPLEVLGGDTKEFVVKIYKTVLGRTNPLQDDPEGVVYWTNAINNGLNKAAFIDEMTAVAIKNGGSDKAAAEAANAAYVNDIYTNILGRPASQDAAGSQYWIDALNKGTIARSQVVDEINAAAAVNKDAGFQTKNTEYVTGLYKDLLGREPEAEGLKYWTDALNAGTSRAELVVSLINSANSGTGADKANLAAKTEALNSFSNNFSDYNVLPGSETYDNARTQAGTWINDVNSSTVDPTAQITTYLNNGYKAQYEEGTPAPLATTVYATWNGALRGEWADAKDVANAEVTFKVDTEEEKGLVRQAEELGVDINTNTQNVTFKNLNGATKELYKVLLNSNPNSAATVVADGLSDLPGVTNIRDLDGNTKLVFNGTDKIATLQSIDMGNGRNTLEIADAARLADGPVKVTMGDGANDKIILGKGDFSKAFGDIVGVEDIVQNEKTAPAHLKLNQISDETQALPAGPVDFKARKINFDGDFKVTVDNNTTFNSTNLEKDITGSAAKIDISDIRGTSTATQVLTLDTVTEKASSITKVLGNNLDTNLHEVLDLGNQSFANLDQIKDIYAVSANKATLQKASALSDGFNVRGELNVTPNLATDLVDTSADKKGIDLSKITSEALVGGTSIVNVDVSGVAASGSATVKGIQEVIGSKDANVIDNVALQGKTYTDLEKISDISVVTTATEGKPADEAILNKIEVLENGFNLKGNVKHTVTDANLASINLANMTGEMLNATDKSKVAIETTTAAANLTKIAGSVDAELQEIVNLAGGNYAKLAEIKDVDAIQTTGATVLNKAIAAGTGFDIVDDGTSAVTNKNTLNVKVEAADTKVDLSGITASTSGNDAKVNVQADENSNYLVESILGSAGNGVTEIVKFEPNTTNKTFAKLATIDQINDVTLNGQFNSLTSITNANTVDVSNIKADKLTSIDASGLVNLGASDFSALTILNGAVQGNGATISYDNIAEAILAGNLKLNGETPTETGATYNNIINIKATTSTASGATTDLSKITKTGAETPVINVQNAKNDVVLTAANANIAENVTVTKVGVKITGADKNDSIIVKDVMKDLQAGVLTKVSSTTDYTAGGNYLVTTATSLANVTESAAIAEAIKGAGGKDTGFNTLADGQKAAFFINSTADGVSYIYEVSKIGAIPAFTRVASIDESFSETSKITAIGTGADAQFAITANGAYQGEGSGSTVSGGDIFDATGGSGDLVFANDHKKATYDTNNDVIYKTADNGTVTDLGNVYINAITDSTKGLTISGDASYAPANHSINAFITADNGKLVTTNLTGDSKITLNAYIGGQANRNADSKFGNITSGTQDNISITATEVAKVDNVFVNTTGKVTFTGSELLDAASLKDKVSLQDSANVKDFVANVNVEGEFSGDLNVASLFKNITSNDKISLSYKAVNHATAATLSLSDAAETVKLTKDLDYTKITIANLSANDTIQIATDASAASTKLIASQVDGKAFILANNAASSSSGASILVNEEENPQGAIKSLDLSKIIAAENMSGGNIDIINLARDSKITLTSNSATVTNSFKETVKLTAGVDNVTVSNAAKDDKLSSTDINKKASSIAAYKTDTGVAKDTAVKYAALNKDVSSATKLATALGSTGENWKHTLTNNTETAIIFAGSNVGGDKLYVYSLTNNDSNTTIDAGDLKLIATVEGITEATSIASGVITF